MMKVQAREEPVGREPASEEPVPAQKYADPIDEAALHDQLMIALMSEEDAHQEAQASLSPRPPEAGRGMAFELNDPIKRG